MPCTPRPTVLSMDLIAPQGLRSVLALVVVASASFSAHGVARGQNRPSSDASSPVVAPSRPSPAVVPAAPPTPRCPDGMVLAEGEYCSNVDQRCLRWLDPETQMRCAEFAPSRCTGRRRPLAVCVDRYEYPNQPGVRPEVMVSWYEARRACENQHKRLCTQSEWTFACEGPEMNPYPTGLRRDPEACRIDHQTIRPNRPRLSNPMTTADESARLYEAVPSGSMPRCVSWAGVHDMTGNVDEWAINETGKPFNSALKGGWWGHIRARCRPSTISHNEGFVYYQIGFRCCADPTASTP